MIDSKDILTLLSIPSEDVNRYNLKQLTYVSERTGIVYNHADKVDMVLKEYSELDKVYHAKDIFCNTMLKLHELDETKNMLDFYIKNYEQSTVNELNKIAKTFTNWYTEIINAYSKNSFGVVLTNAIAESNNNYIQKLINIGYGYTNFNRLKKRILYMSSNRKGRLDQTLFGPLDFTEQKLLTNVLKKIHVQVKSFQILLVSIKLKVMMWY